jgi:hypothetical protein
MSVFIKKFRLTINQKKLERELLAINKYRILMKLKININFIEKYLAYLINDIEYKRITKKLKKYDLLADVDDQRFHHFRSTVN